MMQLFHVLVFRRALLQVSDKDCGTAHLNFFHQHVCLRREEIGEFQTRNFYSLRNVRGNFPGHIIMSIHHREGFAVVVCMRITDSILRRPLARRSSLVPSQTTQTTSRQP